MTAVGLLILIALGLSGSDVLVGLDAEVVDLLADEGGHGLGVEGKGRGRVVGGAGAVEDEGVLQCYQYKSKRYAFTLICAGRGNVWMAGEGEFV